MADAPLAALSDADALAKSWLMTLIARAPLEAAARVPAAELAARGPALCGAIVEALASEPALDRLRPGGELAALASGAGSLGGSGDPAGAALTIGSLRDALWSALSDAVPSSDADIVGDLAARLAHVCDVVASAALAAPEHVATPVVAPPPAAPEEPLHAAPEPQPAPEPEPARLAPVPDLTVEPAVPVRPPSRPLTEPRVPADVFPMATSAHDERTEPWATAVMRRLSNVVAGGEPCTLLAVDIDDAERLLAADERGEAAAALDRSERAIREALRPEDAAVRERAGRLWVIAPRTGPEGARVLGGRLVEAAGEGPELHGAALRASVGIAVYPDDGTDPAALVAHADEGVYAARAAGIPVA